jgi:glyoxylase-like metal-dependent hydrolase (beta-lactamase superfamily II)
VTDPEALPAFPIAEPPGAGQLTEVAPGLLWLRLALPFRLNHVNIYLLEDGDGYAAIDTGIGDAATQAIWEQLLDGPLKARPLTQIIVTHFHPDHVGMAGWLCERTGAPLLMSQTEYLTSRLIHSEPEALDAEPYRSFYLGHGLDPDTTAKLLGGGNRYLHMVTGLPRTFRRLVAGEVLQIGTRALTVLTGGGHAPEQVMLHDPANNLLLAADQVLARISPNISVQAMDPDGDPLGIYLRSLAALNAGLPANTLVLPGHDLPFTGLHARTNALAAHHAARCEAILDACRIRGLTGAELVPVVFRRPIDDPHQMGFAFSEALAHANLMLRAGTLRQEAGRYHAA